MQKKCRRASGISYEKRKRIPAEQRSVIEGAVIFIRLPRIFQVIFIEQTIRVQRAILKEEALLSPLPRPFIESSRETAYICPSKARPLAHVNAFYAR